MYQKQILRSLLRENEKLEKESEYDWLTKPTGEIYISEQLYGSGCLISNDVLLACLKPFPYSKDNNFASLMTANFRYPDTDFSNIYHNVSFDVLEILEHHQDFTILQLDGNPGEIFGTVNLSNETPEPGTEVALPSCQYGNIHKTAETTPLDESLYYLAHQVDAIIGAPVGIPNSKTVVALHTTCFEKPISSPTIYSGITIESIRKASKILQNSSLGFFSTKSTNPLLSKQEKFGLETLCTAEVRCH